MKVLQKVTVLTLRTVKRVFLHYFHDSYSNLSRGEDWGNNGLIKIVLSGVSVGEGDSSDPHYFTVLSPSPTLTPRRTILIGPLFPQSSPHDKIE